MRVKTFIRRLAAMVALLLVSACAAAVAEVRLECHLGYNDTVTFLRAIPFTARVTNDGGDAAGVIQLDVQRYDTAYDRYELPVTVAAGATVEVSMPVKLTFRQTAYTVRWVENGQTAAQTELKPAAVIDPASLIIGVLSDSDKSLAQHEVTQTADPLRRAEYLRTLKLSAQTFPADLESMQAFDILMVDGFDPSTLSARQQTALDEWLHAGGMVIVGGGAQAAASFPYFAKYTGITAGPLADGGDVSEALLAAFKSTGQKLGGAVRVVPLTGAKGDAIGGERTLVDVTDCGDGSVFTCAFSLSEAPFADWQRGFALWQRMLLEYRGAAYSRALEKHGDSSRGSRNYVATDVTGQMEIPNGKGMALPVVLLAAFVLLVGFGSYFLLKRFDKREWMWATVPALALAFSLGLWAVSGALELQKPAAASYTVLRIAADGARDSFTGVTVTTANAGRVKLSAAVGEVDPLTDNSYYYNNESSRQEEMTLRYVYTAGADGGVEMPGDVAWSQRSVAVQNAPVADCAVSGECALDGEALAFTVRNEGAVALEPGLIVTDYGFVMTDGLLPGQTLTARLAPDRANPQALASGALVNGATGRGQTAAYYSYYDYFQAYYTAARAKPDASQPLASLQYSLLNNLANNGAWNDQTGCFHYVAFAQNLCEPALIADGEPVTRTANYGMVDVSLRYDPIAADGTVRFLRGSFPAYTATLDAQGKPRSTAIASNMYNYYQLGAVDPAFAYDLSAVPDGMRLVKFSLTPSYVYYSYAASFYNVKTGAWDDVIQYTYDPNKGTGTEKITVTGLENYVDEDDMLYAQFHKLTQNGDYAEIGTPILTMDGRMD